MLNVQGKQKLKRVLSGAYGIIRDQRREPASVILNYHSVHPSHPASTTPQDFARQMGYLKSHFTVVPLADFCLRRGALSGRVAVITFDDGYRDNYEHAFPVLKRLGLPATIFLTTGFLSGEHAISGEGHPYLGLPFLEWEQVREMQECGISFGAHTHSHPVMSGLDDGEAEREIVRAKTIIEEELAQPVRLFAYPQGQRQHFTPAVAGLLKKYDFQYACSTIWGTDNRLTDPFALHRVRIDAGDSLDDFIAKVNGRWNFIGWFQQLRR